MVRNEKGENWDIHQVRCAWVYVVRHDTATFRQALKASHRSPNPWTISQPRTLSGTRVFTLFLDLGEETGAHWHGAGVVVVWGGDPNQHSARGVGPAQRPSLRSCRDRLKGSGVLQVPEGNAPRGRASALPAGSLFHRAVPLFPPWFPSVSFQELEATLTWSTWGEGLREPALSPSARTMPDSLTGVG